MDDGPCENDDTFTIKSIPMSLSYPKPKWQWDFLGDGGTMVINTCYDVSWWQRLATRLIFQSKWKRL